MWKSEEAIQEDFTMLNDNVFVAENGTKWVRVRYRRVKNSDRYLDAMDYGREYWCFPIKSGRKK